MLVTNSELKTALDLLEIAAPIIIETPVSYIERWCNQENSAVRKNDVAFPRQSVTDVNIPYGIEHILTNSVELSTTREATRCAATRQFPAFYGTRRFITEFTRALHLYLS
jgi:hypothetical protein